MDNTHLQTLIRCILFIPIIPLCTASISLLIEAIMINIAPLFYQAHKSDLSQLIDKQTRENFDFQLFRNIRDGSMIIYSRYEYFIITMLLLHAIIEVLTLAMKNIVKVPRKVSDSTDEEPQENVEDSCIGFLKKSVSPHTQLSNHFKKAGMKFLMIIIQYTLLYYFCFMLCSLAHFSYDSISNILHGQEDVLFQKEHIPLTNFSNELTEYPMHLKNRKSKFQSERVLSMQDTPDIISIIGSLDLLETPLFISKSNNTQITLFYENRTTSIDVSNYTSPIELASTPFKLEDPDETTTYWISPDTQIIVQINNNEDVYITNVLNPLNPTKLKFNSDFLSSYTMSCTFSHDSKVGYLANQNLYRFDASSDYALHITPFNGSAATAIVLSGNSNTAFVILPFGLDRSILRILDLTDSNSIKTIVDLKLDDTNSMTASLAISSDDKLLFVLSSADLAILNISTLASPEKIYKVEMEDITTNHKLVLSPDDNTLIIQKVHSWSPEMTYVVDVSDPRNPTIIPSNTLTYVQSTIFSPDSRFVFMFSDKEFKVGIMLANVRLEQQLSYTPLNLKTEEISLVKRGRHVAVSLDAKLAFVASDRGLEKFTVSHDKELAYQSRVDTDASANKVILSPDNMTALVGTEAGIIIVNISTMENINSIPIYVSSSLNSFILSPDGTTIITQKQYAADFDGSQDALIIFDITDPMTVEGPTILLPLNDTTDYIYATNWEILVGGSAGQIAIYNISDLSSPEWLCGAMISDKQDEMHSIILSLDNKTLFIETYDPETDQSLLLIYNISSLPNINLLNSTVTAQYIGTPQIGSPVLFPSNPNILMLSHSPNVLIIDTLDKKNPYILGYIPVTDSDLRIAELAYMSSTSEFPLVIADGSESLKLVKTNPRFTLNMPVTNIGLGQTLNCKMTLLERNTIDRYTFISQDYQFMSVSLYNMNSNYGFPTGVYSKLPDWITFDSANEVLRIEPTSEEPIEPHYIYSAISTKIEAQEFINKTSVNSTNLLWTLIGLGYVDNRYYLTSSFDPNEALSLPPEYNSSDENAIRNVLADHYFGIVKQIFIQGSLFLDKYPKENISIRSPSQLPLSITISLPKYSDDDIQQCQFVSKFDSRLTPAFTEEHTVASLEGLLFEINDVLAKMIINLNDDELPCNGTVVILDGLNPRLTETITNISDYFQEYQPPTLTSASKLQKQINKTLIHTGAYFIIMLDRDTFTQDDLQLSLINPELESWLTLTSLSLSGVPPEPLIPQFWPSKYEVWIKASNEYKDLNILITLNVQMSSTYYVKLFLKVLSIIGFWVYFYTVFNILCKKIYTDPRKWILKAGEEIKPSSLLPIAFVRRELRESKFIIQRIQKTVAIELRCRSITKEKLVEYFVDQVTGKINDQKLFRTIENVVSELPTKLQDNVRQYNPGVDSRKDLINQLILNELVMVRLHTKEERRTRQAFERIKSKWTDLIQVDEVHLWQFHVDQAKLEYELELRGVYTEARLQNEATQESMVNLPAVISRFSINRNSKTELDSSISHSDLKRGTLTDTKGLNVELMNRSGIAKQVSNKNSQINVDLLRSALVAYASKQQHLNIETVFVNVASKERVNIYPVLPRVLTRFLKLDLQPLLFSKGQKIGYGIKYRIVDDILQFYGTVSKNMRDKTIAIQIVNKRGRILRELWVEAVETDFEQESLIESKSMNDEETPE